MHSPSAFKWQAIKKRCAECCEGIDGSGKSTLLRLLEEHLARRGLKVIYRHYPDHDYDYGRIIVEYLYGKRVLSGVEELFMLYLIDMVRNRATVDKELGDGSILIMDRYFLSTVAYQSAGGFDYEKAKAIENLFALQKPDVVFYIDLPAKEALLRKKMQKASAGKTVDRHEGDVEFEERIRQFYKRMIADGFGARRWVVIDGHKKPEEIGKEVAEVVDSELS